MEADTLLNYNNTSDNNTKLNAELPIRMEGFLANVRTGGPQMVLGGRGVLKCKSRDREAISQMCKLRGIKKGKKKKPHNFIGFIQ